jgi:release factor glutamine methyltransferase
MADKLQTITDIHRYITGMLSGLWPSREAGAMASAIITEYTGMSRAAQMAFGDRKPDEDQNEKMQSAAVRASKGEPLQYIFGYTTFCGHRIGVMKGVLIPRPETEEMACMIIEGNKGFRGTVTDLCTGSGCIAIALSLAFPESMVFAMDNSPAALKVAAENTELNGASVTVISTDILTVDPLSVPRSDIIVSNPPYVTAGEKSGMHINVIGHEPHEALFVPDTDPMIYYRSIIAIADRRLATKGSLWLEVNENLAEETARLPDRKIYSEVRVIEDISGKKRFLKTEKK